MAEISRGARKISELDEALDFNNIPVDDGTPIGKRMTKASLKALLTIEGTELEPLVGGDSSATALVVANGPAGEQRTAEVASGKWYDFGSGPVQASADRRWKSYWNGTAWALKDMGALPQPIGKDSFNPQGTDIPNERAIAGYVEPMMSLLEPSTNLADNSKMLAGAYILADGSFVTSPNSISLPKQKIKESETFISIDGEGSLAGSFARIAFYNESGSYISGNQQSEGIPIPSGAAEFGVTVDNTEGVGLDPTNSPFKNTLMVNYGETALPYQPYSRKISSEDIDNTTFVEKSELSQDYTIGLVSDAQSSSATAVLLVNREVENDGSVVKKIKVNALSTGNLRILRLKRTTYNFPTPSAGNQDSFSVLETINLIVPAIGENEFDVNITMNRGEYLGIDSSGGVRVTWNAVLGSTTNGWWQRSAVPTVYTYQPIDINLEFEVVFEKYELKKQAPKINYIMATRNGANYNSIRDIVKGITDASEDNRYAILVPRGRWFEVDLRGNDFVDLVGDGFYESVLYCDGNDATKTLPSDYSYPSEAGKVINTVNQTYLHVVFGTSQRTNYTNIQFEQTRGKYCAHLDNSGVTELEFNNCKFYSKGGTTYPIGIGGWGGQKIRFRGGIIEREKETSFHINGKLGVFFHNQTAQSLPCELDIREMKFVNCGYAMIDELGSNQFDRVNLINCDTNDIGQITFMVDIIAGKTPWTDPSTGIVEPDPKKVPYNIYVNAMGTRIDLVVDRSAVNFPAPYNTGGQRPNWHNYITSDYWGYAFVNGSISKGDLLGYGNTLASNVNTPTAKKFVGFSDTPILGVALTDSENGQVKYVQVGKYVETSVNGAIGTGDINKKIVWDDVNKYLKADATADVRNIQGLALASKTLTDTYGYIKLK